MGRLIGNRVMLREYRQEDLSALRAWVNDTETTRYLAGSYRRPQTWEQTEEWLMRRLNGDAGGEGYVIDCMLDIDEMVRPMVGGGSRITNFMKI